MEWVTLTSVLATKHRQECRQKHEPERRYPDTNPSDQCVAWCQLHQKVPLCSAILLFQKHPWGGREGGGRLARHKER